MENAEEIMHCLEEFSKIKPKDIPHELDAYLNYVAKTGDPVFKWSIIKCLFREKMLNVITDFYESTLGMELPPCPNVDPFNYERMKANLLEKLDSFHGAPFTVQRISELLTNPRKEYNRADKFMRAIEKNILVGSTREPGRYAEVECDSQSDPSFNGVPEANDIKLEPTGFQCNDLGDPADSSSHPYEEVRPFAGIGSLIDRTPEIVEASCVEQLQGQLDSLPPEQPSLLVEDKLSAEFETTPAIDEVEKDGVICSAPCLQSDEQVREETKIESMEIQESLVTAPQSEKNEDSNPSSLDEASSLQAEASSLDQTDISQPETPLFSEGQDKDSTSVEEPALKTFDSSNDDLSLNPAPQVDVPEEHPSAPPVPTADNAITEAQPPSPVPLADPVEQTPLTEIEPAVEPPPEIRETSTTPTQSNVISSVETVSILPEPEHPETKPKDEDETLEDKDPPQSFLPTDPIVCFPTDEDSLQETTQPQSVQEPETLDTPPAVTENGQPPCRDSIIHTTSPFTDKSETQPMEIDESSVADAPPSDQIDH